MNSDSIQPPQPQYAECSYCRKTALCKNPDGYLYPCCCDDCFESEDGRQSVWSGPVEFFIEKHASRWFLLCCHRCCGEDGLVYRIEDPGPEGNVEIDDEGGICGVVKWHGYDETGNIKPGVTW